MLRHRVLTATIMPSISHIAWRFFRLLAQTTVLAVCCLTQSKSIAEDLKSETSAEAIISRAVEYWRDSSSYAEAVLQVNRPDFNRTLRLKVWTHGDDKSLVRFVAPAKDAGSASLTRGNNIWMFTPKTNRVIRIPPSMMHQSWMGSDFSYRDLSRSDEIVHSYTHYLRAKERVDERTVFVIEAAPKENAPVVWGKEVLRIREDAIILQHEFYDQEGKLVKRFSARNIEELGGKLFPVRMRMEEVEKPDHWTEIYYVDAAFGRSISPQVFSIANLRNPRDF